MWLNRLFGMCLVETKMHTRMSSSISATAKARQWTQADSLACFARKYSVTSKFHKEQSS